MFDIIAFIKTTICKAQTASAHDESTPIQLRFAPSAGFTLRTDFNGGGLSSDLGPLLLRGVDQQIGLTGRLSAAIDDRRHPGYVKHAVRDVLTQRIFQIASGYEDGNDSNSLRQFYDDRVLFYTIQAQKKRWFALVNCNHIKTQQ